MSSPAVCVRPHMPLRQAAETLARHRFAAVPVVDGDHRLSGILAATDVLRFGLDAPPPPHPPRTGRWVAEVMTTSVVRTTAGATTAEVAEVLLGARFRSLPVCEGDRVVGVLSRGDLLRAAVRDDSVIAADVHRRLADLPGALRDWRIEVADGVVTLNGRHQAARRSSVPEALARETPGVHLVLVRRWAR